MNVKNYSLDFPIDPSDLSVFLTRFMLNIQLPIDSIEYIYIADEKSYAEKIREFNSQFTNNEMYVGVGKTIAHKRGDVITNTVLYRDFVVASIIAPLVEEKKFPDEFHPLAQLNFYVIYHELCHCLDSCNRRDIDDVPFRMDGKFSVRQIAKFYQKVLASEFAASFLAGFSMTKVAYCEESKNVLDCLGKSLQLLEKEKENYRLGIMSLYKLAVTAAMTFWLLMIQYSKLIGCLLGNPDLTGVPVACLWPSLNPILGCLAEKLQKSQMQYPKWDSQKFDDIFFIWQDVGLSFGYRFVEGEIDAVYLTPDLGLKNG
ncbi:MAG: hypothetical protein LiPW30_718 [Parcubacteria group bacterium LiPW_30]|nr:MAG: hypothetical protein LiPW30_718 [Parcubacteria group bacterium LiPW_30]